jgi:hypothetical protein
MGDDTKEAPESLRERSRGLSWEVHFQLLQTGQALELGLSSVATEALLIRRQVDQAPVRSPEHWLRLDRLAT